MQSNTHSYRKAWVLFLSFFVTLAINAQRMPHGAVGARRPARPAGAVHNVNRPAPRPAPRPHVNKPDRRPTSTVHPPHNSRPSHNPPHNTRPSHNPPHHGVNHNVNVNVHHHHHHGPKPRPVPPHHPPYVWGGFHIYFWHPYHFFPYDPYYWNGWYPWGEFVTSVVETAIIVSVINDNGEEEEYSYDEGNFYYKTEDGFVVVAPPVGAKVPSIPSDAEKVTDGTNTYYYYGGTFYEKSGKEYVVVIPAAGTVVAHLPEGAEEVKIGDNTYVKFDNMYFQPVQVNKKNAYEIVEIKEE